MKFSIGWHEDSLKNQREHYKRERERLDREYRRLAIHEAQIIVYTDQIEEAKARGLDGFDSDRFMKSRPASPAASNASHQEKT